METLPASIFRAYDIRGIVGKTLTEQGVYLIGKALGSMVLEKGENQLLVARDGRNSGNALVVALTKGILATGCDVIDLGQVATPVLYYAAAVLDQRSGVMVTGSHNPPEYNGLKMVVNGVALTEDEIKNLYHRIIAQQFCDGSGTRSEYHLQNEYIQAIAKNIHLPRPLKIVIDAGNGVAGNIAPALFKTLGCEVVELYCDVDGMFPNHHPDPSDAKNLQDLIACVRRENADVGLAFDGDGDRLGVVTNQGQIIWPDRLLMLFAKALLNREKDASIIFDIKCTHHLATMIETLGGKAVMWKTGHSLIKAKMTELQAQLAGEMSGHFFFKDRWYGFDDALYAGARLLEIIASQTQSCHELFAAIPNSVNTPELKVSVSEEEKFQLMQTLIDQAYFAEEHEMIKIDGLRVNFAHGWGLVRPSNTTPYLILRFEAINEVMLSEIQLLFRQLLLSVKPELELPF